MLRSCAFAIANARDGGCFADPSLALRAEWPAEAPRASAHAASKQEWRDFAAKLVELGLAAPIAD